MAPASPQPVVEETAQLPIAQETYANLITHRLEPYQAQAAEWCSDANHFARLYIPAADINVGLLYEWDWTQRQDDCDRQDTACVYSNVYGHYIIADHKTQAFQNLINVEEGDYIFFLYGDHYDWFVCTAVFDGHNAEYYVADADWNNIEADYDWLCYTCLDWWQNIRVVAFKKVE